MVLIKNTVGVIALVSLTVILPFTRSLAQESSRAVLEEVIVTAQKREMSMQDTAVSISVLDSAALSRNGISDLHDLASYAPGVNLAVSTINTVITIRGVSSRDTTEIGDPAVALSMDGFYFQRTSSLNSAIFDLDRVEVMRGPQGTLYGRNATGGAINFVSAKPQDEFASRFSVGVGNYNALKAEGMVNVPLSDTVKVRASFLSDRHDGYRTNNSPTRAGDDLNVIAGRLHVQFEPTDRLSILLSGQTSKNVGVGPTLYGVPLGPNGIVDDVMPPLDPEGSPHGYPEQDFEAEMEFVQWNFTYDFDFAQLSYMGGIRDMSLYQLRDLDGVLDSSFYFDLTEGLDESTHELRLTSTEGGSLEWMVGAFYFNTENSLFAYFQDYTTENAPTNLFTFLYPDIQAKSESLFGQVGYYVTDNLKLEGGLRYSDDSKSRSGFVDFGGGPFENIGGSSSSKTTYHLALNYDLTPNSMLFTKHGTGYKAGGFTDVSDYGPETITATEIGVKNRFLDNTVELNFSAYYNDYKDQQISQFKDGVTTVFNAGASEIYGFDLEGTALLSESTRVDGFVGYLSAEFTDFCTSVVNGECAPGADFAGNAPPQAPEWQIKAGIEHDFAFAAGTLTARAQTHYESESYLDFTNFVRERQDGYTRSDILLTYRPGTERWSIEAYVRNLEDETILNWAQANTLWQSYTYSFAPPRTYGLNFTVEWEG
jgi:iron complex outermembrane receptor protein